MDNLDIVLIAIHSFIVAISYRKAGFIAAFLWPLTVLLIGITIYIRVITSETPPPNSNQPPQD